MVIIISLLSIREKRCEEIFSFFVDKTVPAPEVKRSLLILIPFPDANTLSKVYVPSGTLTLTPIFCNPRYLAIPVASATPSFLSPDSVFKKLFTSLPFENGIRT